MISKVLVSKPSCEMVTLYVPGVMEYCPLAYCWPLMEIMESSGVTLKLMVETLVDRQMITPIRASNNNASNIRHKRTHLLRKKDCNGERVLLSCICLYCNTI